MALKDIPSFANRLVGRKTPGQLNKLLGAKTELLDNTNAVIRHLVIPSKNYFTCFLRCKCKGTRKESEMNIPEYISKGEVQRICEELGIRDWTKLAESLVTIEEAKIIQNEVGSEALQISVDAFKMGLEVELEHGVQFPEANVTNNHPILTGKIVLAHLKEMLDYYERLEVAELEGDVLKAFQAGDSEKMARKYQQLLVAKAALSAHERESIVNDD